MNKNRVKEFRTRMKLSQRKLAAAVGTSQQQIQRIETGTIAARLDLANQLSAKLGVPIDTLFPGSGKVVRKLQAEFKTSEYIPTETYSELSETGVEAEVATWHLKILLRGHDQELLFEIPPAERRRLYSAVQHESDTLSFIVFDTETDRIAVNLGELAYCHFLFDVGVITTKEETDSGVEIYFTGSAKRFDFSPEVDRADPDDEEDVGDFGNIFLSLDVSAESHERFRFTDVDGEDVFVRAGNIALLKVPLWVAEPSLLDSEDDDGEEGEEEQESEDVET